MGVRRCYGFAHTKNRKRFCNKFCRYIKMCEQKTAVNRLLGVKYEKSIHLWSDIIPYGINCRCIIVDDPIKKQETAEV